jgi:hypothetical protein
MKLNAIVMVLLAVVLLGAPASYAQSPAGARPVWDVPFDFVVGDQTLPAGQYTVQHGVTPGTVLVRSLDGQTSHFRIANTIQAGNSKDQSTLVFNRYGSQNFLARVWVAGRGDGVELKQSKVEREMARRGAAKETVAMKTR